MTVRIRTRDIPVDGYTFHVNETGPSDGEPVVWLHGSGPGATALSNWEQIIGELGDTYHCGIAAFLAAGFLA